MAKLEYSFDGNKFPLEVIRETVNREWERMLSSKQFADRVAAADISRDDIPNDRERAITIEESGDGLDPVTLTLLIGLGTALTPKVAMIVEDLWKDVILPRIRQDKGENSLKEK